MKIIPAPPPTHARLTAGDLTSRLRERLPTMRGANATIAAQILDDPSAITQCSIGELARLTGTSPPSITRFCRSLEISGYPELKLLIAAELGQASASAWDQDLGATIGDRDSPARVTGIVVATALRSMQRAAEALDLASLGRAADAVAQAGRCAIFGVGGSFQVAAEAQLRLHRIGRPVWAFNGLHDAKLSAALSGPGDVFVAISRSGRTAEVIEATREARARGATTIALTSFASSPLTAVADIVLATPVQDISAGHGSLAVKYAQMLVVDCLYSLVAQRSYGSAAEALARTATALAAHRAPTERPRKPVPARNKEDESHET
jgi:DNA-binding MurR/RpiR family transcriptional regulator